MGRNVIFGEALYNLRMLQHRVRGIGQFNGELFEYYTGVVNLSQLYLKSQTEATEYNLDNQSELYILRSSDVDEFIQNFMALVEENLGLEQKPIEIQQIYVGLSPEKVFRSLIELNFEPRAEEDQLQSVSTRKVFIYYGTSSIHIHYVVEGVCGELVLYLDNDGIDFENSGLIESCLDIDLSVLMGDFPEDDSELFYKEDSSKDTKEESKV